MGSRCGSGAVQKWSDSVLSWMLLTISYRYFPEISKVIPSTSNPSGIDLDFAWQKNLGYEKICGPNKSLGLEKTFGLKEIMIDLGSIKIYDSKKKLV